jgi:hypothetical protein
MPRPFCFVWWAGAIGWWPWGCGPDPGGAIPHAERRRAAQRQLRVTIAAAGVTDAAGNALSAPSVFDFFALAGDIDRDRDRFVNGTDFAFLAGNFGKSGMTYETGDLNGNGRVDSADFSILAGDFGKLVAPPPPAGQVPAGSGGGACRACSG